MSPVQLRLQLVCVSLQGCFACCKFLFSKIHPGQPQSGFMANECQMDRLDCAGKFLLCANSSDAQMALSCTSYAVNRASYRNLKDTAWSLRRSKAPLVTSVNPCHMLSRRCPLPLFAADTWLKHPPGLSLRLQISSHHKGGLFT